MAGRPKHKALFTQLELRTRDRFEDETSTHLDYVCEWVSSGKTLTVLAEEITTAGQVGEIDTGMLRRYLLRNWPADTDPRLNKARRAGAHTMVEEARKLIDDTSDGATRDQLQRAKLRGDVRMWTAERWNKEELGKAPDIALTINHNTLHLDALRQRAVARVTPVKETVSVASGAAPARLIGVEVTQNESEAEVVDITEDIGFEALEANSLPFHSLTEDTSGS
jgi:hypothetical protein